ncbi:divergent PAP2 family protein [Candidatus Saccharibacteria bacterium]|jgi:acid phosphatase family membrane protein YuiD|nr:divergent PAP2 family protein [Candidatus Saccharibacteria bacterium]
MEGIYIIVAFALSFMLAQLIKIVAGFIKKKGKMTWLEFTYYLTKSGGMPSGHSAGFSAVTTYLGFSQGITSPIFALAFCMTVIIVYDAVNVRYAVGEQGKLLTNIIKDHRYKNVPTQIIEGHTVPEAAAGIVLGVLIGWAIFALF